MPEQSLSREFWPPVCPGYSFLPKFCLGIRVYSPVGFLPSQFWIPLINKHVKSNLAHNWPNIGNLILLDSNV
jgi:hypothetical protein